MTIEKVYKVPNVRYVRGVFRNDNFQYFQFSYSSTPDEDDLDGLVYLTLHGRVIGDCSIEYNPSFTLYIKTNGYNNYHASFKKANGKVPRHVLNTAALIVKELFTK